ncbi:folate-binding protein [Massilia arenosa]|uniref:Folate-binding protein n=1 Tax=Zemynaea arenosa TaxID=2561931 RepID=A0A4Y9RQ53_9BURK|nr:folate-binding protein YgfZ [Massilia arenosa]TFW11467.1 folate-binding protein [Massilia arenosa]
MNNLTQFLAAETAEPLTDAQLADGFVAPLADLGLIAVTGADAASFLHNQLTNDVEHLGLNEVRLAGYCTPKGRLQATFLMWRSPESIFLQLPREIQPPLQKRLSMFVLRSKAKLEDATPEVALGIGGVQGEAALRDVFGALPAAPNTHIDSEHGTVVRVADAAGAPRYQWLTSSSTADAAWPTLAALAQGGPDAWIRSSILAGVPQITARTQEQFVPQMVNLELLGGVNFKKGCYPGQEIVARSQYLGKLKRRTARAIIDGQAHAGDEVFSLDDPGQPCGMVVNAAPNATGGTDALVEMKLAALGEAVRLGSAEGPAVRFQPLPYELDALDV